MAQIIIDDGWTFGAVRGSINANFSELYAEKAPINNVLLRNNTSAWSPSGDYNPATKVYVDDAEARIIARFDPQGINADAFARENHTGVQAPDTITQDTDNRFVTDAQIATWNGKEDPIGVKNTAFNKNFGTGAGEVAEGNHMHTKADIGLGNVDNTSDVDKPISTAQAAEFADHQAQIDGKVSADNILYLDYIPQATPPAYLEGRVYYDNDCHCLSLYSDITDMTLNIGQEEVIRVLNNTASEIPNATPVYITGAGATLPTVAPAIASGYSTAIVPGIATHAIAAGAEGFITHAGRLGGSFGAFTPGDRVYLSDTVAGAYVLDPPDIATALGTVLDANHLLVRIDSNTALPPVSAYMNTAANIPTIGATYTPIVNYTDHGNVVMEYDPVAGTITAPITGIFRVSFTISLTFASSASARDLDVQFWDETAGAEVFTVPTSITKDVAAYDFGTSAPFSAVAGHVYVIRLRAIADLTSVVLQFTTFDLQSVHIR